MKISICLVYKNNLDHLRIFRNSFRKNSMLQHEIIVHDNSQSKDLEDWSNKNDIIYTSFGKDVGYGAGLTNAIKQATKSHVYIMSAMSYFLPNWERPLLFQVEQYQKHKIDKYIITSALYHYLRGYDCTVIKKEEFFENFDAKWIEKNFIRQRNHFFKRPNKYGFHFPMLLPKKMLEQIGFADKEYPSEVGIDYDLAARAYYNADCRYFIRLAKSRIHYMGHKPNPTELGYAQGMFRDRWGTTHHGFSIIIGARTYTEIA